MSAAPTRAQGVSAEAVRSALASASRPQPVGAASAVLTFAWRGTLKIKHVPEQLIDVTITPVLFVLMFTYLFGGAISGSTGDKMSRVPAVLLKSIQWHWFASGVKPKRRRSRT